METMDMNGHDLEETSSAKVEVEIKEDEDSVTSVKESGDLFLHLDRGNIQGQADTKNETVKSEAIPGQHDNTVISYESEDLFLHLDRENLQEQTNTTSPTVKLEFETEDEDCKVAQDLFEQLQHVDGTKADPVELDGGNLRKRPHTSSTEGPSPEKWSRTTTSPRQVEDCMWISDDSELSDMQFDESDDDIRPDDDEYESDEDDSADISASASVLGTDDWNDGPIKFRTFPFEETTGLKVDLPQSSTPYDIFRLLFSDDLLELIILETNRHAHEIIKSERYKYAMHNWKDVDKSELLVFFALVFAMGVIHMPEIKCYWKTDRLYRHSFFPDLMTRDRFKQILSNLYFAHSNNADKSDKFWKCQPLITHFNDKMHAINVPEKQLSIDESLLLCRGNIGITENKGYKKLRFYMLCQANGLTQRIILSTGKPKAGPLRPRHTFHVVTDLMENYLSKGYSLYMNRFYNSMDLSNYLLSKSTHTTGTLKTRRKGNCKELFQKSLKKGEVAWKHKEGVVQMKWSNYNTLMISTEHKPDPKAVTNANGQVKLKPEMLTEYNKYFCGIDRANQFLSNHDILRKTKEWCQKVALRIIQLMLVNARVLCMDVFDQKTSSLKFQEDVINCMLKESGRILQGQEVTTRKHFPESSPNTPNRRKATRRCRHCSQLKIYRRTIYHCSGCPSRPALCLTCFKDFEHE